MIKTIRNIFSIRDLRRRILITLGLLVVSRIGYHILIPGVNASLIQQMEVEGWIQFLGMITGGALDDCSIMGLGVMPYISASIIFTMLVKIVPSLEQLAKEGASGYRKIQQYERYATVGICLIQASFVAAWLCSVKIKNQMLVPEGGFGFRVFAVASITAGTMFLVWLGEQITEFGIGNGISLLIMNGIVARMPYQYAEFITNIKTAIKEGRNPASEITQLVVYILIFFAVVAFVVLITQGQRRIPVQQQKQARGRRIYGGMRYYLPLRVNQGGVMPIIFAQAILMIPTAMLAAIPGLGFIREYLRFGTFWYVFLYVILIVFFEYFWTALTFNPAEMSKNLREHGNFIPGIRPGRKTAEVLEYILNRIALAGGTFIAFIALFPEMVSSLTGVEYAVATFLGGTGILIVVGVTLEFVQRVESQLLAREYEGFMKKPIRGR
ncbi:MAG: preprotein translocase subunit SecY [Planctomycetota bacterium]|nr:preprotein translocase subunit SecY [Planctomycetota bacterium]